MTVSVAYTGGTYASPLPDDFEEFPSLAAAAREFERRLRDPYYPLFHEITGLAVVNGDGHDAPTHIGHFTNVARRTYTYRPHRFVWERI